MRDEVERGNGRVPVQYHQFDVSIEAAQQLVTDLVLGFVRCSSGGRGGNGNAEPIVSVSVTLCQLSPVSEAPRPELSRPHDGR